MTKGADPYLEAANGQRLTHYGQRTVMLYLEDYQKILITFQVCDVKGPIASVGKFCATNPEQRGSGFDAYGGWLKHETIGVIDIVREMNHYALWPWAAGPPMLVAASGGGAAAAARPGEDEAFDEVQRLAGAARADDAVMADVLPDGAHAPPDEVEVVEPEVRVTTLKTPREPSKAEVERHELLHDPPEPCCEICIMSKGSDACHPKRAPSALALVQFDYAEAGEKSGVENFEFMVGTDLSSGAAWALRRDRVTCTSLRPLCLG